MPAINYAIRKSSVYSHPMATKLCAVGRHNWSLDDATCLDCSKPVADVRVEMQDESQADKDLRLEVLSQLCDMVMNGTEQQKQDIALWDEQEREAHKRIGYHPGQTTQERLVEAHKSLVRAALPFGP